MERRDFLKFCGVTGVGLAIGVGCCGEPAFAENQVGLAQTPVSRMMRGSVRTGCARIPDVDFPDRTGMRDSCLPLS